MTKLTNLKGADVLPKKINKVPGKECKCEAWNYLECGCGADWTDYATYNQCVQSLDKIGVVVRLDRNKISKLLNEFCDKNRDSNDGYGMADYLINKQSSLIELELTEIKV